MRKLWEMVVRYCTLLGVSSFVLASGSSTTAATPPDDQTHAGPLSIEEEMSLRAQACGLNTVYMYLRLHDIDADFGAVSRAVHIGPKGSNLRELRDAIREFGMDPYIYQGADAIDQCTTPYIAHMKPSPGKPVGHFVIVLEARRDSILILDGTVAIQGRFDRERFLGLWGGYVLSNRVPAWSVDRLLALGVVGLSCVLLAVLFGSKPVSSSAALESHGGLGQIMRSTTRIIAGFLTMSAYGAALQAGEAKPPGDVPAIWRVAHFSGVNSVYLFLRLHGRKVSFADLCRELQPSKQGSTMVDLRKACQRFGLDVAIYRCHPDELASLEMPLIVPVENSKGTEQGFMLLMQCNEDPIDVVSGAYVTVARLPWEVFRRRWSGYVLAPRRADNYCTVYCLGAIAFVVAYGACRLGPLQASAKR